MNPPIRLPAIVVDVSPNAGAIGNMGLQAPVTVVGLPVIGSVSGTVAIPWKIVGLVALLGIAGGVVGFALARAIR